MAVRRLSYVEDAVTRDISGSVTDSATTCTLDAALPAAVTAPFYAAVWDAVNYTSAQAANRAGTPQYEVVKVTSYTSATINTMVRAQDGTSAVAWADGWQFDIIFSKDELDLLAGEWANVKSPVYGATGDGSTFDGTAIQAALDEVETAGGGTVFFPPGTYIAINDSNKTLNVAAGTRIIGSGATLKAADSTGDFGRIFQNKDHNSSDDADPITISGIVFDENKDNRTPYEGNEKEHSAAIFGNVRLPDAQPTLEGRTVWVVSDCHFKNSPGASLSGHRNAHFIVNNCTFRDSFGSRGFFIVTGGYGKYEFTNIDTYGRSGQLPGFDAESSVAKGFDGSLQSEFIWSNVSVTGEIGFGSFHTLGIYSNCRFVADPRLAILKPDMSYSGHQGGGNPVTGGPLLFSNCYFKIGGSETDSINSLFNNCADLSFENCIFEIRQPTIGTPSTSSTDYHGVEFAWDVTNNKAGTVVLDNCEFKIDSSVTAGHTVRAVVVEVGEHTNGHRIIFRRCRFPSGIDFAIEADGGSPEIQVENCEFKSDTALKLTSNSLYPLKLFAKNNRITSDATEFLDLTVNSTDGTEEIELRGNRFEPATKTNFYQSAGAGGGLDTFIYDEAVEIQSFADADATPDVTYGDVFKTANTGSTTITDFDVTAGVKYKKIKVVVNDANTTFDFSASSLKGNSGVDYTAASGDVLDAIYDGTNWFCVLSRATGTATNVGSLEIGGPTISSGTGTPEGSVTADTGSVFLRTDGAADTTAYLKETTDGANTGWAAIISKDFTSEYGSIYVVNGATAQTFTDQNTWYTLDGFAANGVSSGVTADHTTDKLTIATAGDYMVSASIAFSGSANSDFEFTAAVGSTEQDPIRLKREIGTGGDIGSSSLSGILTLAASDEVTVSGRCTSAASKAVTLIHANLSAVRVG